jgi:hypothetical protein
LNFRTAAQRSQQNFPISALVEFAGRSIAKGLAEWAVKNALREAAASLNLTLDNDTLDFLADIAVDAILTTA